MGSALKERSGLVKFVEENIEEPWKLIFNLDVNHLGRDRSLIIVRLIFYDDFDVIFFK